MDALSRKDRTRPVDHAATFSPAHVDPVGRGRDGPRLRQQRQNRDYEVILDDFRYRARRRTAARRRPPPHMNQDGHYRGAYNGTLTINWEESGSKRGDIHQAFGSPLP